MRALLHTIHKPGSWGFLADTIKAGTILFHHYVGKQTCACTNTPNTHLGRGRGPWRMLSGPPLPSSKTAGAPPGQAAWVCCQRGPPAGAQRQGHMLHWVMQWWATQRWWWWWWRATQKWYWWATHKCGERTTGDCMRRWRHTCWGGNRCTLQGCWMHTPHAVVDAHMVGQAAMPCKVGAH